MTASELKQLRKLLFIDITEAARLIGECETRTWQRWEKGDRPIRLDVIETMQMLSLSREELLSVEYDEANPNYRHFETFKEYKDANGGGNELKWRLAQSIASQLLCEQQALLWQQRETISDES